MSRSLKAEGWHVEGMTWGYEFWPLAIETPARFDNAPHESRTGQLWAWMRHHGLIRMHLYYDH